MIHNKICKLKEPKKIKALLYVLNDNKRNHSKNLAKLMLGYKNKLVRK